MHNLFLYFKVDCKVRRDYRSQMAVTNPDRNFLTFGRDRHRQFKKNCDRDCHFYRDFYLDFYHLSIKKGLLTLFKNLPVFWATIFMTSNNFH